MHAMPDGVTEDRREAPWPMPQRATVEQCAKFFDADGSAGRTLPLLPLGPCVRSTAAACLGDH